MVVTIPDAPVLASPIRQITSSGMPVVVVNVGDRVWRGVGALTFVGQPDFTAGEEAGQGMAAARGRQALCVIHEAPNTALTGRRARFHGPLTGSGGTVQSAQVRAAQ